MLGKMTVAELVEELEMWPEDTEVRLAIQPSYPFEHSIRSVVPDPDTDILYIAEGTQLDYLPSGVRDELWW